MIRKKTARLFVPVFVAMAVLASCSSDSNETTVASAMDSPSCGMMMGICGISQSRKRFLAAAAMLRAVGRCAAHSFG